MRILVLVSDAFGGTGGIALYNRDLLAALDSMPECEEIVVLPRVMVREPEPMPRKVDYRVAALGGKGRYLVAFLKTVLTDRRFDLVVCGHLNLLPLATVAKRLTGAPLLLEIYGVEAWKPSESRFTNRLLPTIDSFLAISAITSDRFVAWSGVSRGKGHLLPNAIHAEDYGAGPKSEVLLKRYGLAGKKVLMTLGRLHSKERYKGFDEVLEALPELSQKVPEVAYLIVGDGNDRSRLEEKANSLGIRDRVVFAGYILEEEKADHYRLADVYVMPSSGEGFGFVFLEALACGVPAIGSTADGSREALRGGELGRLVDPSKLDDVRSAVVSALSTERREVPEGLEYFSFPSFTARLHSVVRGTRAR